MGPQTARQAPKSLKNEDFLLHSIIDRENRRGRRSAGREEKAK